MGFRHDLLHPGANAIHGGIELLPLCLEKAFQFSGLTFRELQVSGNPRMPAAGRLPRIALAFVFGVTGFGMTFHSHISLRGGGSQHAALQDDPTQEAYEAHSQQEGHS